MNRGESGFQGGSGEGRPEMPSSDIERSSPPQN